MTSATGVFTAKRARASVGIERVERPPGQLLGLDPERAEVVDDGRAALAVAQDVDAAAPVVEPEAEVRRARG